MNRLKSAAPQKGTLLRIILIAWIVILTAKVFFFPSSADDLRERLDRAEARMASLSAKTDDVGALAAADLENRVRRLEEKLAELAPKAEASPADKPQATGSTPPAGEKTAAARGSAAEEKEDAKTTRSAAAPADDASAADAGGTKAAVKKKTTSIQSGKKTAPSTRSGDGDIVIGKNGAKYYRVSSGDTLYQISRRFGPLYGLTVEELRKLNKLAPGAAIYPGQKLLLSPGKDS